MVNRLVFAFIPHILLFPWTQPSTQYTQTEPTLAETLEPVVMDSQPGPSPRRSQHYIPFTPPYPNYRPAAEVIPYDHSRYGMVILTILSLAEVVVPHLGAYRPLAAGVLYLSRSLPFLYWAMVSRYPDGWNPAVTPWYSATPGHDSDNLERHPHDV